MSLYKGEGRRGWSLKSSLTVYMVRVCTLLIKHTHTHTHTHTHNSLICKLGLPWQPGANSHPCLSTFFRFFFFFLCKYLLNFNISYSLLLWRRMHLYSIAPDSAVFKHCRCFIWFCHCTCNSCLYRNSSHILCMHVFVLWRSQGRAWPGTCPAKAPCSSHSCHAISSEALRASG